MGLGTYKQFEKRLFAMKPNIYIGKECVGRDDPRMAAPLPLTSLARPSTALPTFIKAWMTCLRNRR